MITCGRGRVFARVPMLFSNLRAARIGASRCARERRFVPRASAAIPIPDTVAAGLL